MMGDGRECRDVSVAEAEEGDSNAAPMMPGCHIGYCTALYGGDGQMTVTSSNSRGRRDGVEGDRDSRQFGRPLLNLATWPPNFFQCHANLLTTEATVTVTRRDGGDATAPP
jgi:hypothetical protein